MGIITKEVEIMPNGRMISYYKNRGYDAKYHKPLLVKVEDLSKWSTEKIEVLCDMCKKNSMFVKYGDYNKIVENTGSYVCKECSRKKARKTSLEKYGVEFSTQLSTIIDKVRNTNLERYGVESYSQTKEFIEKTRKTNLERYGVEHPLQNKDIQNTYKNTCVERYGEDYCKIFTKKAKDSYYKNTGYNFNQSLELQEKKRKTFYKNGTTPTSRQQFYIFNLYNLNKNARLNYPIKYYSADICFPEEKLDIEIDCGGHDLLVKTGKITQEEHNRKEIIRNNIIKKEGYKQMRIISSKDLLPSDCILFQMLQETRNYFSVYPNHSWIEFNIDTSSVRNAEHKDGISFNYGILRKIK